MSRYSRPRKTRSSAVRLVVGAAEAAPFFTAIRQGALTYAGMCILQLELQTSLQLPSKVGKSLVGLRHAVRRFALCDRRAFALVGGFDFIEE